jgi:hypothetical protein
LPWDSVLIEPEDFSIKYELTPLDQLPSQEFLVLLNAKDTVINEVTFQIDYVTWDGIRSSLVRIEYEGMGIENPALGAEWIPDASNSLLISVYEYYSLVLEEFYVFDLANESVWGVRLGCDGYVILGPEHVVYRCVESLNTWHFLSIEDPIFVHTVKLPKTLEKVENYFPIWIDGTTITFDSWNEARCIVYMPDWNLECQEYPFWVGDISPDGQRVDVRIGFYMWPDSISVLTTVCIENYTAACQPIQSDRMIPLSDDGRAFLIGSAWTPDSKGILYIIHIETYGYNAQAEETEIWLYDVATREFTKLARYIGLYEFRRLRPWKNMPIWSPDGEYVVLESVGEISLFSVETGELQLLTEGGKLLGAITLP